MPELHHFSVTPTLPTAAASIPQSFNPAHGWRVQMAKENGSPHRFGRTGGPRCSRGLAVSSRSGSQMLRRPAILHKTKTNLRHMNKGENAGIEKKQDRKHGRALAGCSVPNTHTRKHALMRRLRSASDRSSNPPLLASSPWTCTRPSNRDSTTSPGETVSATMLCKRRV